MTIKEILAALPGISQKVSIGLTAGTTIFPLISGVILAVKMLRENSDGSVEYEIRVSVGKENLGKADANSDKALALLNSERVRLGEPPLTRP